MKKIRILAVLLAVLMLPIGLLVGCDKPEEPQETTTLPPIETDPLPVVSVDKDGTKDGYLMFFTFDEADRGDFRTDTKPYSEFFTSVEKAGAKYVIDDEAGKDGKGALLIQREGVKADPYIDINVAGISGLTATNIIEFDIKVSEGLIGDTIYLDSVKATYVANLVKITADAVCDGDGFALYEIKETDTWLHIAVAINDAARTYDVYVNGAKMTDDSVITNQAYPAWADQILTTYRLGIVANNKKDVFAYIDNLCIVDGTAPKDRDPDNDNIVYKDTFAEKYTIFEANKESVLALIKENKIDLSLKKDQYDDAGALMNDSFSLKKYNTVTGEITPLMFDYGVELGLYNYGGVLGGTVYSKDADNYIEFKANKDLEFVGKLEGVATTGTYVLSGDKDFTTVSLTCVEGETVKSRYGYLVDGALKLFTDITMLEGEISLDLYSSELPFNGVQYVVDDDNYYVSIKVLDFYGKAELVVKAGDDDITDVNATYTYADNVLTVTSGEKTFAFTFVSETVGEGDEAETVTKFTIDEKTLNVYVEDPYALGENEKYVLMIENYKSSFGNFTLDPKPSLPEGFRGEQWSKIRFEYVIPENGVDYRTILMLNTHHNAAMGGGAYWGYNIQQSAPGIYAVEYYINVPGGTRNADMQYFTQTGFIAWSAKWGNCGPVGTQNGTLFDGYGVGFTSIEFYGDRSMVVKGPDRDHPDCEHVDENGASTFVKTDNKVDPTCTVSGYYELECSVCKATRVDREKALVPAKGHTLSEEVITVYPTCLVAGYTYQVCTVCNEEIEQSTLEATGHNFTSFTSAGKFVKMCTTCSESTEVAISTTLMTGEEKVSALNLATNYNTLASSYADFVSDGTATGQSVITKGAVQFVDRYTITRTVDLGDGDLAFYFKKVSNPEQNAYYDILVTDKFGTNEHVIEFDIKLGEKGTSGTYAPMTGAYGDRNSAAATLQLFTINGDGVFTLVQAPDKTIQLSEALFTNFAFSFNPATNSYDLYVDGVLFATEVNMFPDASAHLGPRFMGSFVRIAFELNNSATLGGSHYFDNFMFYSGSAPVCVLGTGGATGDLDVKNEDGTANEGSVDVENTDVVLTLPENASTYVIDFKLTASALGNGALLTGTKADKYGFDNDLDLISVNEGYIYLLGTPICKVTDVASGARISLVCNDELGVVTAYINGTAVPGGVAAYTDEYYALATSKLTELTFGSAVGTYSISDLGVYTGLVIK